MNCKLQSREMDELSQHLKALIISKSDGRSGARLASASKSLHEASSSTLRRPWTYRIAGGRHADKLARLPLQLKMAMTHANLKEEAKVWLRFVRAATRAFSKKTLVKSMCKWTQLEPRASRVTFHAKSALVLKEMFRTVSENLSPANAQSHRQGAGIISQCASHRADYKNADEKHAVHVMSAIIMRAYAWIWSKGF